MIHVDRTRVPAPSALAGDEGAKLLESAAKFFGPSERSRRQLRFEFAPLSEDAFDDVTTQLDELFHGKCAYCETPLERPGLDRFRPKQNARGLGGDFAPDHYWWLAYTWENLYACCEHCNKIKGPWFPVDGSRASVEAAWDAVQREQRLLVDPCVDKPEADLTFSPDGLVRPKSRRGEMTIQLLELNRGPLVKARREAARDARNALAAVARRLERWLPVALTAEQGDYDDVVRRIAATFGPTNAHAVQGATDAQQPFAAARRGVLFDMLERSLETPRAKSAPKPSGARAAAPSVRQRDVREAKSISTRYVTRVVIKNFRAIRDLDLEIPSEASAKASWIALLGENGTGKSSILQAIALTLIDDKQCRELGVRPRNVLKQGASAGSVRVSISGLRAPVELRFGKGMRRFERSGEMPKLALLGFGATRLLPRGAGRVRRAAIRVTNLFDPFVPLLNADRWLGKLGKGEFDYVARALKDVLSLPPSSRLTRVKRDGEPGVTLRMYGAKVGLDELSDGYQSVLGLVCDVISGLQVTHAGGLEVAEGVVLIDELGAHLHPRWRMRVVGSLRRAFPRVQFLTSTHDPLCLRGLNNREVAVLRRSPHGNIYSVPDLPPIQGLRSEQLLTSEYFGLNSTLDPEIEEKFEEMYRLLAQRKKTARDSERIEALRKELEPFDLPGANQRERLLLRAIDERLAQKRLVTSAGQLSEFEKESRAMVANDLKALFA